MLIPKRVECDFCAGEIPEGAHMVKIELPLAPSVRKSILEHYEKQMTGRARTSPIHEMFGPAAMVPYSWELHVCVGCAHGLMPDVSAKVRQQVEARLDARLAAGRRTSESEEELEV